MFICVSKSHAEEEAFTSQSYSYSIPKVIGRKFKGNLVIMSYSLEEKKYNVRMGIPNLD